LFVEPHINNMSRHNCLCTIHFPCPHTECEEQVHEIRVCKHNPGCIFPDNEFNPNV
jgi:hypothetical protein